MCDDTPMYDAEAIVLGRYGAPANRALLDDPRVSEFLQAHDASPWRALGELFRWLTASTNRAP